MLHAGIDARYACVAASTAGTCSCINRLGTHTDTMGARRRARRLAHAWGIGGSPRGKSPGLGYAMCTCTARYVVHAVARTTDAVHHRGTEKPKARTNFRLTNHYSRTAKRGRWRRPRTRTCCWSCLTSMRRSTARCTVTHSSCVLHSLFVIFLIRPAH